MTWVWLGLAIVFEVGWAIALKKSAGFSVRSWAAGFVVMYVLSVVFLGLAAKRLPISVAYAMWAGSGTALVAIVGMVWLKEPVSVVKVVSIGLVVAGVAGLKWGA